MEQVLEPQQDIDPWKSQKKAYDFITKHLEEENFSSPLIIYGETSEILAKYARLFGAAIISLSANKDTEVKLGINQHPDMLSLFPEGKSALFSMQEIRFLLGDIALPPYESRYKVYILHDVDRMLPVHANALLKTLEEMPSHVAMILTTENIQALLPTILSRCITLSLAPEMKEKEKDDPLTLLTHKAIGLVLQGRYKELFLTLEEIDKEVQKEDRLDDVLTAYFTWFQENKENPFSLEEIFKIVSLVRESKERHTRTKIALEYLFLKLSRLPR